MSASEVFFKCLAKSIIVVVWREQASGTCNAEDPAQDSGAIRFGERLDAIARFKTTTSSTFW